MQVSIVSWVPPVARLVVMALVSVLVAVGSANPAVAGAYGLLRGTVTGPDGLAASTIDVNVMHLDEFGQWKSVGYDSTDRDGHFEVWAPPGTHRLWFKPYLETSVYLPEYYPDAATVGVAQDITVTSDSTQDFAVQLEAGPHASMAGTVVGTDGAPVAGVQVGFWTDQGTGDSPWWVWRFLDETDESGTFRELVKPGTYRVSYRRVSYVEAFYGGSETVETARDVVLADTASAELDAVIMKATRIEGYVRAAQNSMPIPGTRVDFYCNTGSDAIPQWSRIGSASPNWDTGAYSMRVPAGVCLVKAVDPYGEYLNEYYGKAFTTGSATPVSIAEESTVSSINIRMTRRDAEPMTASGPPSISGSAHVAATLSAFPGTWSPVPDRVTYQWLVDGVPIAGATGSSYQPVEADLGHSLTVEILAYTPGRLPVSRTSAPTAPVEAAPTVEPTVEPVELQKVPSITRVKGATRGTTVRLYLKVTAAVPVTGKVKIFRKARLLKTVVLQSGKATATLRSQPRGTRRYKVVFVGSATVLRSWRAVRVTV